MSTRITIERRILRRFLENVEKDKSIPAGVLAVLREQIDRGSFPDAAALELALEEAVRNANN